MRIAQVAPLHESVPPQLYGGTERIVHYLTEELVDLGHEVTLYASADSQTSARLVPCSARSLRLDPTCVDPTPHHIAMLERLATDASDYDAIHFHIDYLHFPMCRALQLPHVTTLHGRLDLVDLQPLYDRYSDMPLVSISDAQRRPLAGVNWLATVLHGLPGNLLDFTPEPADYLAFVGRISPEKRVDRAVEIASTLNMPLKIAAKIAKADQEYFERDIKPLLDNPLVEFVGEIGEEQKSEFIGNARALLFPIDWPEPFGLVMIEAMACGTPVVAFENGSVPEVIDEGETGFVVSDMTSAIDATRRALTLDRAAVRRKFEHRFTSRRMAEDYVEVYRMIAAENPSVRAA
jgi:glycosyltransferase involved in cell wall biosynthesis